MNRCRNVNCSEFSIKKFYVFKDNSKIKRFYIPTNIQINISHVLQDIISAGCGRAKRAAGRGGGPPAGLAQSPKATFCEFINKGL